MKTALVVLLFGGLATALAQKSEDKPKAPPPPERPPVSVAPPPPVAPGNRDEAPQYDYEQKPAPARAPLITAEQAREVIERFKPAYDTLGRPRLIIYVNRALVDEDAGLKLIARTEKIDTTTVTSEEGAAAREADAAGASAPGNTRTTERAARENRYRRNDRKEMTLADRQTVRDIERLMGRPLRMAGARLADQRLATQLMADRPLKSLATEGEQARKDREALARIGDVAIEVLVSSKEVSVNELSGTRTYEVPDIQVTALRLKDSEIIGQASSADVLRGHPGQMARSYDVREVTEAVALALMEDMLPEPQGQ